MAKQIKNEIKFLKKISYRGNWDFAAVPYPSTISIQRGLTLVDTFTSTIVILVLNLHISCRTL